jgi:hypothetical protein
MQDGVLKNEIRDLQRKQGREGANMEVGCFLFATARLIGFFAVPQERRAEAA